MIGEPKKTQLTAAEAEDAWLLHWQGVDQQDIAAHYGVNIGRVNELVHGHAHPKAKAAAQLRRERGETKDIRPIWFRLTEFLYTEESARVWLVTPQQLLDDATPAEMLARGLHRQIHDLLDEFVELRRHRGQKFRPVEQDGPVRHHP
jgi:hypothetical protein